jgi:hypothetical protein
MLQLVTQSPWFCQSTGAVLHSSNFLTTVVLPSVVRAAISFPVSRDHPKQLRADDTMQLQRQAGQLTGQTRPSQHRLVPVASLGAVKAQPCRATAAGPSPASASWGSSMVRPSFAASPLQHRYVLAVDFALQSSGHAWQPEASPFCALRIHIHETSVACMHEGFGSFEHSLVVPSSSSGALVGIACSEGSVHPTCW